MSLEDIMVEVQSDESNCEDGMNLSESENFNDDESNYLELVMLHNNLKCFEHIYDNNAIMDKQYMENEALPSFDSDSEGSELSLIQNFLDSVLETPSSTYSVTPHWNGPSSDTNDSVLTTSPSSTPSSVTPSYDSDDSVLTTSSSLMSSSDTTSSSSTPSSVTPGYDTDDSVITTSSSSMLSSVIPSSDIYNSALSSIQDFVQLYEEVVTTSYSTWSADSDGADGQRMYADDMDHFQDRVTDGEL